MERNSALTLLRILRKHSTDEALTDAQVRKMTGFDQTELDIAAGELEAEGMLVIERMYTLVED